MRVNISYFKDTELFLTATLLNMFSQKYNHYLYLQHNTFYKFLSSDNQEYLRELLLEYRNSLALSDDPLDFVYFVLSNSETQEFQNVCSEISQIRERGMKKSLAEKSVSDELFYTIQGYAREDSCKEFSIFEGSELHTLACSTIDFTVFSMSYAKFLLKRVLNYDTSNFKDIETVITSLSENYKLISEIGKEKPKRVYWEDIICKALKADMEATMEVLDICCMNF